MRVWWSSLSLGWALYVCGLLAVFAFSEMTRSFELFLAVYAAIGLVLASHRIAAGSRIALPFGGAVLPVDIALFALLWPLLGLVALSVLSMVGTARESAV